MTPTDERTGRVVPLHRPPVRQSTLVRCSVDVAFHGFVHTIGAWWPLQAMSVGRDRVRDVTIEEQVGGRVYETWDDATTVDWGELVAWEPPDRFVMTWCSTPGPTEVELTFTALGPSITRVSVEHRGWERLTDEQLREDCAAPGGYSSGAYSKGWAHVLTRFATTIETDPSPHPERNTSS